MIDSPIKKNRISPRLDHSLMASSIQSVNSNGGLSFINELKRLQNNEESKMTKTQINKQNQLKTQSYQSSGRLQTSPPEEPHDAYNDRYTSKKSTPIVPKLDLNHIQQRLETEVRPFNSKPQKSIYSQPSQSVSVSNHLLRISKAKNEPASVKKTNQNLQFL